MSSPAPPAPAASLPPSARPPSGAGCITTPSAPGSTRGAAGSSLARPRLPSKAGRILDLYHRTWQGAPLHESDFVLSADEKTSIQARQRRHPTPAPRNPASRPRSSTNTNASAPGPTSPLAMSIGPSCSAVANPSPASPPSSASSTKSCSSRPTARLGGSSGSLTTAPPIADSPRSGGSANATPTSCWCTPRSHASWLNQVEVYFSVLQRKALQRKALPQ